MGVRSEVDWIGTEKIEDGEVVMVFAVDGGDVAVDLPVEFEGSGGSGGGGLRGRD